MASFFSGLKVNNAAGSELNFSDREPLSIF
jgi:hypothetical protein